VIDHLPTKHKDLSSNPSTARKYKFEKVKMGIGVKRKYIQKKNLTAQQVYNQMFKLTERRKLADDMIYNFIAKKN
jgi:hypothetical protein